MSVIVKNMKMPKNCAYCPLSGYRNTSLGQILDCKRIGTVGTAVRDTHDVLNRRHPNCPLIDIPTPHGRLGDLDKLNIHDISPVDGFCVMGVTEEDIELADTVIEAEGK